MSSGSHDEGGPPNESLTKLLLGEKPERRVVIATLRACFEGGDRSRAVELLGNLRLDEQLSSVLPPWVFKQGINAAIHLDRMESAEGLLADARRYHPAQAWDGPAVALRSARRRSLREIVRQGDWTSAFDCLKRLEDSLAVDLEELQFARFAVEDWVGVLRSEAAIMERAGAASPVELSTDTLLHGVHARSHLGLTREALTLVCDHQKQAPPSDKLPKVEAGLRSRLGDYGGALAIRLGLWKAGGDTSVLGVTRDFISMGDLDGCRAFLEAANERRAGDATHLLMSQAALARAQGDLEGALERLLPLECERASEQYVLTVAKFAAETRRSDLLAGLLEHANAWLMEPADLRRQAGVIAGILNVHFKYHSNWRAVEPGLASLEREFLSAKAATRVAQIRIAGRNYDLARTTLWRSLESFPSEPSLWRQLFRVIGPTRDVRWKAMARSRLGAHMPLYVFRHILAHSDPGVWEPEDIPALIEHVTEPTREGTLDVFLRSLVRASFSTPRIAEVFDSASVRIRGPNAVRIELARARMTDRHLLEKSVVGAIEAEEFVKHRKDHALRLRAALYACTKDGAPGISSNSRAWLRNCIECFDTIDSKAARSTLLSGQSFSDAAEIAGELMECILRKRPTSVVRVGDGEAVFLPPQPDHEGYLEADREAIQRIWWGDARPSHAMAAKLAAAFRSALDRADIIGILPPFRLMQGDRTALQLKQIERAIQNSLAYFASSDTPLPIVASANFHQDLELWNLWPEIFSALESVSWISCHDLGEHLWRVRGVRTRQSIVIPPEHRDGKLFDPSREQLAGKGSLLDYHDEICSAIDPRPGEVYLVAAGFLGKIYCDLVRERGGIGLDIGSVVDYWMGFSTRPVRLHNGLKLAIGTAFLRGVPLPKVDVTDRLIGSPSIVRSSRDGRYNIGAKADAESLPPRARKFLRVIGHPRCATGFMASVFSGHGVEIGHGKLLRDGISSWMHVVADLELPYGDNASVSVDFDHTIALVRDPKDAVPSIILENGIDASLHFRRHHILRATGDDIAAYETPVSRAVASLLHWHEMSMRLKPTAVFSVENAAEDVKAWLSTRPRATLPEERGPLEAAGYDASPGAEGAWLEKPILPPAEWLAMPSVLFGRLAAFCAAFGYALPWEPIAREETRGA